MRVILLILLYLLLSISIVSAQPLQQPTCEQLLAAQENMYIRSIANERQLRAVIMMMDKELKALKKQIVKPEEDEKE